MREKLKYHNQTAYVSNHSCYVYEIKTVTPSSSADVFMWIWQP